jgi:hypothetical protein
MLLDPPDALAPIEQWRAWQAKLRTFDQSDEGVQECIKEAEEVLVWRVDYDRDWAAWQAAHASESARLAA